MSREREEGQGSRLAIRVLESCRNRLFFRYRYLEMALFRLVFRECEEISFGSEGKYLYYDYKYVLNRYAEGQGLLALDYLHTLIHCLYRHPFLFRGEQPEYWNLAADIAVACTLEEFAGEDGEGGPGENPAAERGPGKKWQDVHGRWGRIRRSEVIGSLKAEVKIMSVQRIYTYLERNAASGGNICGVDFSGLCALFQRDDHRLWYGEGGAGEPEARPGTGGRAGDFGGQTGGEENTRRLSGGRAEDRRKTGGRREEMQRMWQDAAGKVLLESRASASHERGEAAGNLIQNLGMLMRQKHDYTEFLMKFAGSLEEQMQPDQEFDYVFYTYGLKLFGKLALLEPLEYREKYLVRDFVIAIDTSGSCQGETVRRFLSKTCDILQQTESFAAKVNIHILQCDAYVQEDVKLESPGDMEEYIAHMTLKGFGGTDFRPVFAYTDRLLETGAMRKVEGLLYFTDGYGKFPARPPKYKTAFVFLDRAEDVKVPSWAMKIYLDETDFKAAD